jgi:hypothetical protein
VDWRKLGTRTRNQTPGYREKSDKREEETQVAGEGLVRGRLLKAFEEMVRLRRMKPNGTK